ncbi:MAG: hypothetical protein M3063_10725 [Actinomycetota bacterium]|nr:hypothetical protein [Actinomycetota bacterium]
MNPSDTSTIVLSHCAGWPGLWVDRLAPVASVAGGDYLPAVVATQSEHVLGLNSLVAQISDSTLPAVSRLAATNIARTYLEAVTRSLIAEAREQGTTWLEIADLFATSEQNIKARFGPLRDYDA